MKTHVRNILILLLVAVVGAFALSTHEKPQYKEKNVILISIDSLRRDHMGVYGYDRNTTPAIDAWAKGAVVFDNYFSTSFLTPISEMSVHTGEYPFTNGVTHFTASLRKDSETLAEILQKHGWQTATFSSSPEFAIFPEMAPGFARGYDLIESARATTTKEKYRDRNASKQAVNWLRDTRDKDAPFFLWLSLGSVHWPYGQDEPYHFTDRSYNGFLKNTPNAVWTTYGFMYKDKRYDAETLEVIGEVTPEDFAFVKGRYDDGIVKTDRMLRELFTYLKRSGLEENTIVILQSEHGESLGERGYVAHYDIFDEEVWTPLLIKDPALTPGRVSSFVSGVDILPTVLDLANVPSPKVDGMSIVPHLQEEAPAPRTEVFLSRTPVWEEVIKTREVFTVHPYDTSIRNTKWKLIHRLSRDFQQKEGWWRTLSGTPVEVPEYELYDLQNDPAEQQNVYVEYAHTSEVIELQHKLLAWEKEMEARASHAVLPPLLQPYF